MRDLLILIVHLITTVRDSPDSRPVQSVGQVIAIPEVGWPPSSLRTTRRLILVGVEQPFKRNRAFGQPWRFTSKIQEGSVRHSDLSFRAALIVQSALEHQRITR